METVHEEYVRTARAKGAPQTLLIRRQIMRNAINPVVAMLSQDMAVAIAGPVGGAVFVERVFGLPGLGSLALESLARRDMPVIVGVVVAVMVAVLVLNLLADILYTLVDPRVRVHSESVEPEDRRIARAEPVPATESA
jgi:peptide/nickel transport system permease protein